MNAVEARALRRRGENTLVFTATYNEAGNIAALVAEIAQQLPAADILICDDNSPDGTSEIVADLKQSFPQLKLITRPSKQGLGTAHKLAMRYALDHHYEHLITMDADFTHHPRYLRPILAQLQEQDFVIASRYAKGGECRYPLGRIVLSRLANGTARLFLGIKLLESTASFRGFRRELLERLGFERIESEGYSFFFECVFRVCQVTDKTREIPMIAEDRVAGVSKISKREIYRAVLRLGALWVERVLGLRAAYVAAGSSKSTECDSRIR